MDIVVAREYLQYAITSISFNQGCSVYWDVKNPEGTTTVSCESASWLARFYSKEGTTTATIIKRIEAFTGCLWNKMRMGLLHRPEMFGQALQMTICPRIQFSWIAFPAALVVTTNGLLASTMFQSYLRRGRVMVWKTSILPFLIYGEQFVVQNAEDMSVDPTESLGRGEAAREPLLDLDQMEIEGRQRKIRFNSFN
jgi:hypothetical protein